MNKNILIVAGVLGLLSVVIGAFAAHGLKPLIPLESLQTFETGVRNQMYHALFLLFVGGTSAISSKSKSVILYLVLVGVILFSGSIYGLATNNLSGFNFKSIGFVTPIGGLFMILGWCVAIFSFWKIKIDKN